MKSAIVPDQVNITEIINGRFMIRIFIYGKHAERYI